MNKVTHIHLALPAWVLLAGLLLVPVSALAESEAAAPASEMTEDLLGLEEESPYVYGARGLRDPFLPPAQARLAPGKDKTSDMPPLQQHALSDYKVVGIVWGKAGHFAMVSTQEGKGYTIRVGSRIGTNEGRVRRITDNAVIVEEFLTDVFGERKRIESVLALRPEEVIP
ncbi:MAG: pilus assembly protein PilP [Leptospirillia bacterium]